MHLQHILLNFYWLVAAVVEAKDCVAKNTKETN